MRTAAALLCALTLAPGCGTKPLPRTSRELSNSIGMRFVLIPPGEFLMGSPEAEARRNFDEGPQHRVRISKAFYLGVTEVTQKQWKAVMESNPSHFRGDDLPVEHVSWEDAREFIKKLSEKEVRACRLPTEAEWEYAARAGTTTPFPFGETISPDQANYDGDYAYGAGEKGVYRQKTTPAASLEPNAWGLYDTSGNVHEWCADWYDAWYYKKSPADDPPGGPQMSDWSARILRGGSWEDPPWVCRSAARHRDYPGYGDDFYGLRLVLEP